jgi:hypothetical protein
MLNRGFIIKILTDDFIGAKSSLSEVKGQKKPNGRTAVL